MLRTWTNWYFNVEPAVRQFKLEHPDLPVLASGATKAIRLRPDQDDTLRRSPRWTHSLRGVLIAAPDGLWFKFDPRFDVLHDVASGFDEAIDLRLPYTQVCDAELLRVGRALVIKVFIDDGTQYQFGLMHDPAWASVLPFSLHEVPASLGWTWYAVKNRLIMAAVMLAGLLLLWMLCGWIQVVL